VHARRPGHDALRGHQPDPEAHHRPRRDRHQRLLMDGIVLDLLIALAILVGLVGAVVQVVPGGLVVAGAVVLWGVVVGGTAGWTVVAAAVVFAAVALVLKYLLAGRYLKRQGVPSRSLVVGAALGIIGFFVMPVVGLFVG